MVTKDGIYYRPRFDQKPWERFSEKEIDEIRLEQCTYCRYRGMIAGDICCDYISHTGHSRGCPPNNCDKFMMGNRKKIKVGPKVSKKSKRTGEYNGWVDIKPSTTYFGRMLEEYMNRENIMQRDFAQRIGVKEDAVSRWRFGKQRPRRESINRVCKVLGITPEKAYKELDRGMI